MSVLASKYEGKPSKPMKRFRELVAAVRSRFPNDNFFDDFERNCADPLKRRHYRAYDDALKLLDDESWQILKEKAIIQFVPERPGQRKQTFFNHLNEAFAYRYLLQNNFQKVRFIPEGTKKSPDLACADFRGETFCEVKTVGISDDEIARRSNQKVYDGTAYFHLSPGFQNKVLADINQAWEQIHSYGESGLVFVVVRFDDIALDYYPQYRRQLIALCQTRRLQNLVIKIGHRGHRRIRVSS